MATSAPPSYDTNLFDELCHALARGDLSPERSRLSRPPAPLHPGAALQPSSLAPERQRRLIERGHQALEAGHVAALLLNGGMATRFGGAVKGVVPVVPGQQRLSFLAVKLAGIRQVAEGRRARVPTVIMHSFATAAASQEHLAWIDWSGLPSGDRRVFEQSLLPRLLPSGAPLYAHPDAPQLPLTALYAAPGHGDALLRLRESGTLTWLEDQGVRHLMISNVDNLGATLDPLVLGAHLEAIERGDQLSVEAVERRPGDAGGCIARVDGRAQIIEAFRLPVGVELADYPLFNTNTLWVALEALRPAHPLTWFSVRKRLDHGEAAADLEILQFETLIGQLSEFVPTACLLVERPRFLPIKTREELRDAAPQIATILRASALQQAP